MMLDYQDKHILVVGLGYRTGLAVSNFLAGKGARVTVTDVKREEELASLTSQLHHSVERILGNQDPAILERGFDEIILSPGVPVRIPLIQEAYPLGVPVLSEIELASRFIRGTIIAVTGTDGKSTTVSLVYHILKELGFSVFLGGNIGTPLVSLVEETSDDSYTVIELSSYQLETVIQFKPHVAALLNFSPDHLDRYDTVDHYFDAKMNITLNQDENDLLVVNGDDENIVRRLSRTRAQVKRFSRTGPGDGAIDDGTALVDNQPCLSLSSLKITGPHNSENLLAALLMVQGALSRNSITPPWEEIAGASASFPGLPHRMEKVGSCNNIDFINDSKATTVGATIMALQGLDNPVLIIGGQRKGDDYSRLLPAMRKGLSGLVCIGESSEEFMELFGEFNPLYAKTMEEAVRAAFNAASPGNTLLLSPACASFDMFRSFEERGEEFRKWCHTIIREKSYGS